MLSVVIGTHGVRPLRVVGIVTSSPGLIEAIVELGAAVVEL